VPAAGLTLIQLAPAEATKDRPATGERRLIVWPAGGAAPAEAEKLNEAVAIWYRTLLAKTSRIRLLSKSEKYKLLAGSMARLTGLDSDAASASPPSPRKPGVPFPAKVVMIPS